MTGSAIFSGRRKIICALIFAIIASSAFQPLIASETNCEAEGQVIASIEYEGNNTTRRKILDRQHSLTVGETLACDELIRARQAIEDLGLFKKVSYSSELDARGVNVLFTLVEKRYLLLLPYLGTSESGSFSYGLRGNWSNIGGINQRAKLKLRNKSFDSDLKDSEKKAVLSFTSPQIRDTDIDASIELGYIDLSTIGLNDLVGTEPFNEIYRYSTLEISRWFHQEQRQQGWKFGTGLSWRAWETESPDLIGLSDAKQSHIGLELSAHYNKIHDRTYSYDGYAFTYRVEPSYKLTGNRSPLTQEVYGVWHSPYGAREHSEIEVRAGIGWSNGAYADFVPFQNSANGQLRGISYENFEGDRYYYLKTAYLTPYTFKPFDRTRLSAFPSLRAEVFAEVNDIYFQDGQRNLESLAWSVGTGVRWRIPWLVGLQVGAGVAYHSEEKSLGFYISGR